MFVRCLCGSTSEHKAKKSLIADVLPFPHLQCLLRLGCNCPFCPHSPSSIKKKKKGRIVEADCSAVCVNFQNLSLMNLPRVKKGRRIMILFYVYSMPCTVRIRITWYSYYLQVGLIMYFVRTPCEWGMDAISATLTFLWEVVGYVEGLFFKDLKQTMKKEQCEVKLLVTASMPGIRKESLHLLHFQVHNRPLPKGRSVRTGSDLLQMAAFSKSVFLHLRIQSVNSTSHSLRFRKWL